MREMMDALVYRGKDTLVKERREVPRPGTGEALIRVRNAGICGTDLSILAGMHPRAKAPLVMGHEFAGEIVELNEGVESGFQPGDRVTAEPLISCGVCYACKMGFPHVCSNLKLYGIDEDGAFAGYVRVPVKKLYLIPQDIPFSVGALIEPLSVAVHAVRRSGLSTGDRVCVLGGGAVGTLTALVAQHAGTDVVVFEKQPKRVSIARELGVHALCTEEKDPAEELFRMTGGKGADVVFEAAGAPESVLLAPVLCRIRGELVVIAVPKDPRPMDLVSLTFKEITVRGIRVYEPFDFERAIRLISAGMGDLEKIIHGPFRLDKAEDAFSAAKEGKEAMRVLFQMD
jgi:(R,R)-butanediol dehydrogenase/meso-butanediol dehydrogenase/diacetyl reductase